MSSVSSTGSNSITLTLSVDYTVEEDDVVVDDASEDEALSVLPPPPPSTGSADLLALFSSLGRTGDGVRRPESRALDPNHTARRDLDPPPPDEAMMIEGDYPPPLPEDAMAIDGEIPPPLPEEDKLVTDGDDPIARSLGFLSNLPDDGRTSPVDFLGLVPRKS